MIDTHDDWNPNNPINQEENEPLSELEQLQDDYADAYKKVVKMRKQLKKLAGFEECIRTFGSLTYEQQTEKNEILNQYLK